VLVEQLMMRPVQACRPGDTLAHAARLMWDYDCGCLPVCGGNGTTDVVGVIIDRDICMCALFEASPLQDLQVAKAMSRRVWLCRSSDSVEDAETIMRAGRIRRLPVIDDGGMLVGMLALADLAREAARERGVAKLEVTDAEIGDTLAEICGATGRELAVSAPLSPAVAADRIHAPSPEKR
jgi:CBS domain-containing protein